ncbi:MAG: YjbQ family protein [Anaerolineae bacterium]|nr:YjbQ family protein [Anaerolineae bacterium]
MVKTEHWVVNTSGNFDVINLTSKVRSFVEQSNCQEGQVTLYFQHTTGAVIIAEHEVGILADLQDTLHKINSPDQFYHHHLRGVDQNGHAHIWSILVSSSASITVPVSGGELLLGALQDILLVDWQTDDKPRRLVVQVLGE